MTCFGLVTKCDGKKKARRTQGQLVAPSGTWDVNEASVSISTTSEDAAAGERVQQAITTATQHLLEFLKRKEILQPLTGQKLFIQFFKQHNFLVDYDPKARSINFDLTVVSEIPEFERKEVNLIYQFALLHALSLAAGFSAREAVHLALGIFQSVSTKEQDRLIDFLVHCPVLDHGSTLATFLKDVTKLTFLHTSHSMDEVLPVSTLDLEEQYFLDGDVPKTLKEMLKYRNHRISWLLGQLEVDLPYDREAFRECLFVPDTKIRRDMAYKVLRTFDQELEKANSLRLSNQVRNNWLEIDQSLQPVLLVGRESRAFGNQAFLFANSKIFTKTSTSIEAARKISDLSQGAELLSELSKAISEVPSWVGHRLQDGLTGIKKLLHHLGPAVGRIKHLVLGASPGIPYTQHVGASQQLREALQIFHLQATKLVEKLQTQLFDEIKEIIFGGIVRQRLLEKHQLVKTFVTIQRILDDFSGKGGKISESLSNLDLSVLNGYGHPVAFSILLQRPSPTGSERFKNNELEEKPEQEEPLRKLVRLGGENVYTSPSYDWVAEATDIIEAVPLFIYERTLEVDGKHVTIFEVDQEGLEGTIRQMAPHFARNISKTLDSEHVSLAREIIAHSNPTMFSALHNIGNHHDTVYRKLIMDSPPDVHAFVGYLAAWISGKFSTNAEQVERMVEDNWRTGSFITRKDALRIMLVGHHHPLTAEYAGECKKLVETAKLDFDQPELQAAAKVLREIATSRQRSLPAFHLLTTEAPGLVEGFIQTVLEEEMALSNVIHAKHLQQEVQRQLSSYKERIYTVAQSVVKEFHFEPIVEQYQNHGLSHQAAVLQVLNDHIPVQEQVALHQVLWEVEEAEQRVQGKQKSLTEELECVKKVLSDAAVMAELEKEAGEKVWERNRLEADLFKAFKYDKPEADALKKELQKSEIYAAELENNTKWLARKRALEQMAKERPELFLNDRFKRWHRNHTSLASTTAKREVIAKHNLHALVNHPLYYYGSGVLFERDGTIKPTGYRKRYHLVYAPSRVNLGKNERFSVEGWSQWIGVSDPLSAIHAKNFYEYINFNPIVRTIKEAENLKVSENQWTALIRSLRNVQAYFVERLGQGDIEDLAYQFNQRGGLAVAAHKEVENYMSGPTAGYCIPKDLLFKLFVATHQDHRKLSQIGVPAHLHRGVINLMVELAARQSEFASSGEWEKWAVNQFLSPEVLQKKLCGGYAKEVQDYLSHYLEVTEGTIVFHLSRLVQVLGTVGVPSPLIAKGTELHSVLWSSWADRKITLSGEQVNRSLVFPMTREIPECAKVARKKNPGVPIAEETELRVHFFGTYKSDEDEAPPPDVRYSWVMRAFMILSGQGKPVALSLDEEGQILARLSWEGFNPDSTDPEDLKASSYLAKQFVDQPQFDLPHHQVLVDKLKQLFPRHTTVGDITITVVPGVSSDDLLSFSAETHTLLQEDANYCQETLQAHGISPDQMKANAVLRRSLGDWVPLKDLSETELKSLIQAVGRKVHPLVLKLRGPGENFKKDIQGQDVVVFSVTHPELMAMNPARIRDLMLVGRKHSALVILDMVSQGKHRVWFDRDVMLWYSACRGVDERGELILHWTERDQRGRSAVYKAFGSSLGNDDYRPLLGTNLREEVARQEKRAIMVWECFNAIAEASKEALPGAIENLRITLKRVLDQKQIAVEADLARNYEQQLLLNTRFKPRDRIIREVLEEISNGIEPEKFTEIHWLAIGGMYLLNGTPEDYQKHKLKMFLLGHDRLGSNYFKQRGNIVNLHDHSLSALIIQSVGSALELKEKKGKMFSVKASEDVVETAVARRKALILQGELQAALRAREIGFASIQDLRTEESADKLVQLNLRQLLIETREANTPSKKIFQRIGVIFGWIINGLKAITAQVLHNDELRKKVVIAKINTLTNGRELDLRVVEDFCGTYETHGILSHLFDAAKKQNTAMMDLVGTASELVYTALALEKCSSFFVSTPEDTDERVLCRSLAEFFAKTIDDHFYEYNPWFLDPKRVSAFHDHFDELGQVKPDHSEWLYEKSWNHHRLLYPILRDLIVKKTKIRQLTPENQNLLLGEVKLGDTLIHDEVTVCAIGGGAPARWEMLWRQYCQLRDIVFMMNDGFSIPFIFPSLNPIDPNILNSSKKVNFCFLSAIGRTHYAFALMSATAMKENLFITRNGVFNPVAKDKVIAELLFIEDGHFWLSEEQYRYALKTQSKFSEDEVEKQIAFDKESKRLSSHGIRVAARFSQPVPIGSAVTIHHHYLEKKMALVGYPTTDKSPILFDLTYNKSLYPLIFNPPSSTGVLLPPEIDWLQEETQQYLKQGKDKVREMIKARLSPFALEHGIIICKGAAESGARNLKRFDLLRAKDQLDEEELDEAVEFIYQVSMGQHVTIQKAIISSPLQWMDSNAINDFIERQIREHAVPVNIERNPKDTIYGTLRVIFSAGTPSSASQSDLDATHNWVPSHWISLSSLQIATNVGRQGTLEMLTSDMVREEFKSQFIPQLETAGKNVMSAISKFGPTFFNSSVTLNHETYESYHKRHPEVPESDACGVPYWWPRYLMIDFLPEAILGRDGVPVKNARLVDFVYDGKEIQFIAQEGHSGPRFQAHVLGFNFWSLEPNVGIGLWPNYWRRELARQRSVSKQQVDWGQVGLSDRIVLSNFLKAGREFLNKKLGPHWFV